MKNKLVEILKNRSVSNIKGVYSACTANETVIEACMEKSLATNTPLVIEATSNQVNQYGGYTSMTPTDYVKFIQKIAEKVGFNWKDVILGGDHLGPLTWATLPEEEAMKEAKELVRLFTLAGFTKIHLDTSMRLKSDDPTEMLKTEVIARRGAELVEVAEAAYKELLKTDPEALAPCYIVGSEVPIPGGEQEDTGIVVTKPEDFKETVQIYTDIFTEKGLSEALKRVVGVVVQPGVEFGDETIHEYKRTEAAELVAAINDYPDFVFEGHSTDYQTPTLLKEMVEDNIAILKVGPGLTFAYREGLFALAGIEAEMFAGVKPLSNLKDICEATMMVQPKYWEKYYHGDDVAKRIARRYSFSDRIRYYLPFSDIDNSIKKLFSNFDGEMIPLTLLSQYMPRQYASVRAGTLKNDAYLLVKDFIGCCIDDYLYATVEG